MPNQSNIKKVEILTDKFKNSSAMYFAKYTGMDVEQATKLRMEFTDNNIDFYIAKNTLSKIAAKNAGFENTFDDILSGQIANYHNESSVSADFFKYAHSINPKNKEVYNLSLMSLVISGNIETAISTNSPHIS